MAACAEGIMPLEHDIIDKFPTQCDFGGYPSFDDAELPNQNNRTAEKISNTPPRQQEHRRLKRIKHEDLDIPRSSASDEGPSPCDSFRLAWLTKFANLMTTWLHSLAHHHQNCRAIPANVVVRITICIFESHLVRQQRNADRCNGVPIQALAAASLWIAIKFAAARHSTPNASFLGYITGVSKSDLLIAELAAMESISWDVYSIARQVKVVF